MRLHLGAPREPLFAVIGEPPFRRSDDGVFRRELSLRPTRRITWLYGISWRTARGFVFFGAQFHAKQEGES